MTPIVSIIIVNYNGCRFMKNCLASIKSHLSVPYEVIVVDNASTDGSVEYLRRNFPDLKLVVSEKNLGFAGGNNLGAKEAVGEFILLLNNDTELLTDVVDVISSFQADKDLGVAGCRMSYEDGRLQYSVGFEATPLRLALSWLGLARYSFMPSIFKRMEYSDSRYDQRMRGVDWVSGAFFMTRRSVWDGLGGLDDAYFMYVEDIDFCKRARISGLRVDFFPTVRIIHYEGSGKQWIGARALLDTMRSFVIYHTKFSGPGSMLLLRIGLGLAMLLRSVAHYLEFSDISKEKARAYLSAANVILTHKTAPR